MSTNDSPKGTAPDYDVIVLGCGPAGLQAAIHSARKRASTLVMGRPGSSSLARAHIENYCCLEGVHSGEELLAAGRRQAQGFGARFLEEDAVATAQEGELFAVTTESGRRLTAYALVMATGVSRKGLGLKGEKELVGKGVSYCVDCDANFYRDGVVAVTGDGSAAAHGALTLSKIAREVHLVAKGLQVSPALMEELRGSGVDLVEGEVKELEAQDRLTAIVLEDGRRIPCDCLFIEKGAKGAMELAAFLGVNLDPERFTYILTDQSQATNVPGIYAAGDICGQPFQMAKAVGEGCVAGLSAAAYASKKRRGLA